MILRSPDNITDVDPDTEEDWDREYRPKINKIAKPTKKRTRSIGRADVESLIDLEDYSPRGPSRKRRGVKVGSSSNAHTVGNEISFVESVASSGDNCGPSEGDSEDHDTPPSFKTSKIAGRSRANDEAGKAKAGADTIFCASSTGLGFATEINSARQKKLRRTGSYEAKTAERVAEIAAKRAPHLVALARVNAEAEQLREQLRMKRQEREIMEKVLGVVHSRERGKIGVGRKARRSKTTRWVAESGNEGPFEISSGSEVARQMSLLREELQEESEGWNSLFDEPEKLSGVDSRKANKPTIPQPRKKIPGKSQETSEPGEKGQNEGGGLKSWLEENTDGEFTQRTGSGPAARFPVSDCDSLFGDLEKVEVQGGRGQFGETKQALYKPKISQQERKGLGGSQSIYEKERERQHHGRKRKYQLESNTDGKLAGQKTSQKTFGFPASESDSLSDGLGKHSEQGSRKKFKKATEVLQEKPVRGVGIYSKRKVPYEECLGLQKEKVASKKKVEYDEGGDLTKTKDHLSNCQMWKERVEKSHQELATSTLETADGVRPGEIGVKHLSLREAVGGEGSIRGAQEYLGAGSGPEHLGGKQSGGSAEDEFERVSAEIDALLEEYGVNSASPHDRRKSPERYHLDPLDPLPGMIWEGLVGVGCGGDSSTMVEHAASDSVDKGLGAPDGDLESVQKQLEKDLDFIDWDGAEAEFLKFDDDADLDAPVEGPKGDLVPDGVGEQDHGIENGALALQPQHSPQKPLLPQDIPEESTCEKALADLEEEKMEHHLGGSGDQRNHTPEGNEKKKIYNPVRMRSHAGNGRGRARARPYSTKELADYSIASLFRTYRKEIEEMEMKATKPVTGVSRRGDRGMGGESKSDGQGVGNTSREELNADALLGLARDKAHESKAGDLRTDTPSEWSGCGRSGKREQGEGVKDVTPNFIQCRGIVEKEEAEVRIADAAPSFLELSRQKKESRGFVGVDISSPEDGGIPAPGQKGSDSISLNISLAETPEDCMSYIGAGCEEGSLVGKAPGPNSAVFPGETATLYRVELPDGSMGYVLAEMVSGVWSMVFLTDSPGDGHGKTQESPPQQDSDGGLLSEAGERSIQSPRRAPQLISEERVRSELPKNLASGYQEERDGKDFRPAGRQSYSSPLKRAFPDPNWGEVEEGKQQEQGSSRHEFDTLDRHEDNNDWD